MRDAVIVAAVRTPVGKRNGALATVHPVDLSAHVLNALAERAGLADPAEVDDVIWGCVSQVGEQTFDIARNAVLAAGWPQSRAGRHGRQAVRFQPAVGALRRRRPDQRPVRPGGRGRRRVDEPGADGLVARRTRSGPAPGRTRPGPRLADAVRRCRAEPGDRRRDDRRALGPVPRPSSTSSRSARTRRRRPRSTRAGSPRRSPRSSSRTAPSSTPTRASGAAARSRRMAKLKPAFRPDGVIHAGNSSQISDGAAALLMTTSENAARNSASPRSPGCTPPCSPPTTRSSC